VRQSDVERRGWRGVMTYGYRHISALTRRGGVNVVVWWSNQLVTRTVPCRGTVIIVTRPFTTHIESCLIYRCIGRSHC